MTKWGPGRRKFIDRGLFRALNGAGAWTGAGAGVEKKSPSPWAIGRGGAGNGGGGPPVSGPCRPHNDH